MNLIHLTNIAIKAVLAAGEVIKEHLNKDVQVEKKEGGNSYASQVVTKVDRACEEVILTQLLPTCTEFDLALLTEETEDDGSRLKKDFFWCVDPMDGTLPFINKKPGFSVAIALLSKDGTPQIGVVYDPSTDTLYHAIKGNGAFKNRKTWEVKTKNDFLTYVTDKKLKDTPQAEKIEKWLHEKAAELNLKDVKEMAGAGSVLNAIYVLENGPACMLKLPKKENGGGSLWDYAATTCMYQELGFTATNYNGGRLDLNRRDSSFMNHEGVFFGNL